MFCNSVTPGTLVEDNFLQPRQHNYLLALHFPSDDSLSRVGIAWTDLSTGELQTASSTSMFVCGSSTWHTWLMCGFHLQWIR